MDTAKACKQVCQEMGVPISMELDSAEPPIFTKDTIRFNGLGPDGAETFLVKRVEAENRSFCNTYNRPYDQCVVACLVILRDRLGFTITSDAADKDKGLTGFEEAAIRVRKILEGA